jgi:hypothetical protein
LRRDNLAIVIENQSTAMARKAAGMSRPAYPLPPWLQLEIMKLLRGRSLSLKEESLALAVNE